MKCSSKQDSFQFDPNPPFQPITPLSPQAPGKALLTGCLNMKRSTERPCFLSVLPSQSEKLPLFNKRHENITFSVRHFQMPLGPQFLCFYALITLGTNLLLTACYTQLQLFIIILFVCLAFSRQVCKLLENSGFILFQCPYSILRTLHQLFL